MHTAMAHMHTAMTHAHTCSQLFPVLQRRLVAPELPATLLQSSHQSHPLLEPECNLVHLTGTRISHQSSPKHSEKQLFIFTAQSTGVDCAYCKAKGK